MAVKIISAVLILFVSFTGIMHGWQGLKLKPGDTGPEAELLAKLKLGYRGIRAFSALNMISGILILSPWTFLVGDLLSAVLILFLMIMFLRAGAIKAALTEIPFLIIPILLIFLRHPLEDWVSK